MHAPLNGVHHEMGCMFIRGNTVLILLEVVKTSTFFIYMFSNISVLFCSKVMGGRLNIDSNSCGQDIASSERSLDK